jgi:hypothetical protein
MSTVDEYKAAMNELAAASKAYAPISAYLTQIRDAVGHSSGNLDFLQETFGLKQDRNRSYADRSKYRLDLSRWPTGEEIREVGGRLAKAYNSVHKIYAELPTEDREYIKAPPYGVDLK